MSEAVRMVVLVERDSPDSEIAVSRGWVLTDEQFAAIDAMCHYNFGRPVQEGMRDLAAGTDLYT